MSLAAPNRSHVVRNLLLSMLALWLVLLVGTVGYRWLSDGHSSWVDAFYMTFITIASIGFSEVVDVSNYEYGRLFTVFIGITGIGTMGYALSTFTAFMLESDLNIEWRRSKMRQKISKLEGHYIVCGVGRVGSNVVFELTMTGRTCVLIDQNLQHIENCLAKHPHLLYLQGDATDNDILLAAGVKHARGVFAVAQDDSQNLVISLSAKQLNPKLRVVARCHDVKNVEKTLRAGADEIVSPDFTGGLRLVSAMVRPQVVSFLDDMLKSDDNLRMEEIAVPEGFDSKPLSVINPAGRDFVVLALRHHTDKWLFNPHPDHTLHAGDVMMVMTTPEGRSRLEQLIQGVA
ncbi:MAG TPA: potassium channel protein [Gallionellaceae bacterium]